MSSTIYQKENSQVKFSKVTKYIILILSQIFSLLLNSEVNAQNGGIIWEEPFNISQSDSTSTDPFLLSDPAGFVHLFWAEKKSEQPTNNPDTLMYTRWDGINGPSQLIFSFHLRNMGTKLFNIHML